ncbi:MAG: recombinase family protein, partial [Lachnospiraceae bacterium]|nr:recombinase family protein [Lachnospiraceae bacterium]
MAIIDRYTDDGETGSNTDRPGFQRMLQDMRSGRIDCAVSKDLSRFSRNYIDAGNYLEKIFPAMGIRYIAINDNYDSQAPGSGSDVITLPFKNLVNDIYCRDISIKIRTSLEVKRK